MNLANHIIAWLHNYVFMHSVCLLSHRHYNSSHDNFTNVIGWPQQKAGQVTQSIIVVKILHWDIIKVKGSLMNNYMNFTEPCNAIEN